MTYINGVNLLPGTGEFTLDTIAYLGQRALDEPQPLPINFYASGATSGSYTGEATDFPRSIDNLVAAFPGCETVSIIAPWFFDSIDASTCRVYPSTTYINGAFYKWNGSAWVADTWKCSGLTQFSIGLVPISTIGGDFVYAGTPSDQCMVRAIEDLKIRGLRVVFYPFLLGDSPDKTFPWRGRIGYGPDKSSAAEAAVAHFLGSATTGQFTRDATNKTVSYSGSATDWTYRRMILHYANLCVVAGGVDLFLIGSELRGLETIRGASWIKDGGGPPATWDYPFVEGLKTLADDVRSIFDGAGFTKDLSAKTNLISYAADWSAWMGVQHTGSTPSDEGQWPHLDQLYAHTNIDLVCFDNYLPLSDWTTGNGGLDVLSWTAPKFSGTWPPDETQMNGLGLTGTPNFPDLAYFKTNIEGGEKFSWFYAGSDKNLGRGFDPSGSGDQVSRPEGPRRAQARSRFYPNQEILANKQLRWWWNHTHKAVYPLTSGGSWDPQGNATAWTAQAKSIAFTEYGYPSCDKGTNQPNLFFDPRSAESGTPFWSKWVPVFGGGWEPLQDHSTPALALQAMHEYWFVDGNNETSGAGVVMVEQSFSCVWAWDARPFPTFPNRTDIWGDAGNWRAGQWVTGKAPYFPPGVADASPGPGTYPTFPPLVGLGWSVRYTPSNVTIRAEHVSGREVRAARTSTALLEIEINYDFLRQSGFQGGSDAEVEMLGGFYADRKAADAPFVFAVPSSLGLGSSILARFAEDTLDLEEFVSRLWRGESVKIMQVRSE